MNVRKKIRVVVLMGGKSPEHEISLISGREVVGNLDRRKYLSSRIVISKSGKGIEEIFRVKADVVFVAMHGPFGEDGTVQGMLELAGLKYTGSGVTASAIGMDKIMFRKVMRAEGIPVPKSTTKFPCFVKPYNQGSSVGASIVRNERELAKAIKLARKYSDKVLVEEYLVGKEVTCAVLGNEDPRVLPVIEIVPLKGEFFDYESKYTESGAEEIVPARISKTLTKKVQDMAAKVYQAIGCRGFGRVDFILKDNKHPVVLEINTIPGLTPMSLLPKAARKAGYSYPALLETIIKYAL
ncbi:MAG: D-alanine-D-alanine ligase [Candidatus Woesebacteria bacterium GW2011_GWC2_45_9]|uniref:D-alanine--D-alanine ligase n=1 Tax=Candidatus Woesebacteria bacterium GW2011_GWC2_45_9 TaxID=1618589 RepID=A0A0G1NAZ5_9BACT|nr:MAG: D-alanine-D-alanine ligase [Candidatus Woesebacteria bacterium GW2011_GWC2_45_9]